jgi:hypothetical protein
MSTTTDTDPDGDTDDDDTREFGPEDFDLVTAAPGASVTVEHDESGEQLQGVAGDDAIVREHQGERDVNTFSAGVWSIVDEGAITMLDGGEHGSE